MSTGNFIKFFGAEVHVNNEGLISLNSIHRHALVGSGIPPESKSPRHWLANKETQDMLARFPDSRVVQSHGAPFKGTYADAKTATFYAVWASQRLFDVIINLSALSTTGNLDDFRIAQGVQNALADNRINLIEPKNNAA